MIMRNVKKDKVIGTKDLGGFFIVICLYHVNGLL